MKGFFLLLCIFGSQLVNASDSTSFRLDEGNGSMAKVRARDQGHYNDCYANTAAEMIDAWRFSHGDRRIDLSTSAIKLAIDAANATGKAEIGKSSPCLTVNIIKQRGARLCNDRSLQGRTGEHVEIYADRYLQVQRQIASAYQFRDQLADLVNRFRAAEGMGMSSNSSPLVMEDACHVIALEESTPRSLAKVNQSIIAMLKLADDIHGSSLAFGRSTLPLQLARSADANEKDYSNRKKTQENEAKQFAQDVLNDMRRNGFNTSKLPTLENLITALKNSNDVKFLNSFISTECTKENTFALPKDLPACQVEVLVPPATGTIPPNAKELDHRYAERVRIEIDKRLSSAQSQPLAIGICDELFSGGASYSSHISTMRFKSCSQHIALLIGKRINPSTHRTEYLLRNSFGKDCKGISRDFECVPGQSNFWMDAEAVGRNVFSLQWF